MAAGHGRKPAVARIHVVQVVGHDKQAVADRVVPVPVVMRGVQRCRTAVQRGSNWSLARPDDVEIDVIQPQRITNQLRQVVDDARVVDQLLVRLAPFQQVKKPMRVVFRGNLVLDAPIQDFVQGGQLVGIQGVFHHQESLQVKQISFILVHEHMPSEFHSDLVPIPQTGPPAQPTTARQP